MRPDTFTYGNSVLDWSILMLFQYLTDGKS
jgi:hypothetical protein